LDCDGFEADSRTPGSCAFLREAAISMTRDEVRGLFREIRVNMRGDLPAPHKPLLVLFMLGRCFRGESRTVPFVSVKSALAGLLIRFRNVERANVRMEYPFWHLCNDGVWGLEDTWKYGLEPGQVLRNNERWAAWREYFREAARGGFLPEIQEKLENDQLLVCEIAHDLLDKFFSATPSLRPDILQAVGLPVVGVPLDWKEERLREARDSNFRQAVLENYGFRCALCKWSGLSLDTGAESSESQGIGLEAAHIRAHSAGGPAVRSNGLALCATDHKLFDYGAFTVSKDLVIQVSSKVKRIDPGSDRIISLAGERIVIPEDDPPEPAYLKWRYEEIFRSPEL